MNEKFIKAQIRKIERTLDINGVMYKFYRPALNLYGEPLGIRELCDVFGIYSTKNKLSAGDFQILVSDAGNKPALNLFSILTTWEYAKNIRQDDTVIINGKTHKVTDVLNYLEMNSAAAIMLEVVRDGIERV